jgi:hypothetical protein
MPGQDGEVLEILKRELRFLEFGFYRLPTPGRPLTIFEDSPTCFPYEPSCQNCLLMRFVPEECRSEPVPCRYIPLNDASETVDSLYRTGTQEELERALRNWLMSTIKRLEQEQGETGSRNLEAYLQEFAS